jgi:hypothetical protein
MPVSVAILETKEGSKYRIPELIRIPVLPSFSNEVCFRLFLTDFPVINEPAMTPVRSKIIRIWDTVPFRL